MLIVPAQGTAAQVNDAPRLVAGAAPAQAASVGVVSCLYGPTGRVTAPGPGGDDAVLVTDDPRHGRDGWRALVEPRHHLSQPLGAAVVKATAHEYTSCDVVVWQAPGTTVTAEFLEWARQVPAGVVRGFAHPTMTDLVAQAEWAKVAASAPFVGSDLAGQAAAYRSALPGGRSGSWQPTHLWTGVLAARRETWERFAHLWLVELTRWSALDELSLPYVLWRAGVQVEALPLTSQHARVTDVDQEAEANQVNIRIMHEWGAALQARDYHRATSIGASMPSDIYLHMRRIRDLVISHDAKTVVELGIRYGMSAVAWLAGVQAVGGHLWAVDIEDAPEHVLAPDFCTVLKGFSTADEVVSTIMDAARSRHGAESGIDLVFVDTNHDVDLTYDELETWAPHVRVGGIFVMHDGGVPYFPHHDEQDLPPQPPFPVRVAIERFLTGPTSVLEGPDGAPVRRWRLQSHTDECNGFTILERMC